MAEQKRICRRNRGQWEAIIRSQEASGLSASAFCREHGVSYQSFCAWRKKLAEEKEAAPRFQELVLADGNSANACFELVIGAVIVRIPPRFDENDLLRIVKLVAAGC